MSIILVICIYLFSPILLCRPFIGQVCDNNWYVGFLILLNKLFFGGRSVVDPRSNVNVRVDPVVLLAETPFGPLEQIQFFQLIELKCFVSRRGITFALPERAFVLARQILRS